MEDNKEEPSVKITRRVVVMVMALVVFVGAVLSLPPRQVTVYRTDFSLPVEHETPRSSKWPKVEKEWKEQHPCCYACGKDYSLVNGKKCSVEVHHKKPFHDDESLELDPDNLITLCRRCHELLGHLDEWRSYNPEVEDDCARLLKKIQHRPK